MQSKPHSLENIDSAYIDHDLMLHEEEPISKSPSLTKQKEVCGWEVDDDVKEFRLDFIKVLNSKLKVNDMNDADKLNKLKNSKDNKTNTIKSDAIIFTYQDSNKLTHADSAPEYIKDNKTHSRYPSQYHSNSTKDINNNNNPPNNNKNWNSGSKIQRNKASCFESPISTKQSPKKKQNSCINLSQSAKKRSYIANCLSSGPNSVTNIPYQSPTHESHNNNETPTKISLYSSGNQKPQTTEQPKSNNLFESNFTLLTLNSEPAISTNLESPKKTHRVSFKGLENLPQKQSYRSFGDSFIKIPLPNFQHQHKLFLERTKIKQPKLWELYHLKRISQSRNLKARQNELKNINAKSPTSKASFNRYNVIESLGEKDQIRQSLMKSSVATNNNNSKEINGESIPQINNFAMSQELTSRSKIDDQNDVNLTANQGLKGGIIPETYVDNRFSKFLIIKNSMSAQESPKQFLQERPSSQMKPKDLFMNTKLEKWNAIKRKNEIEQFYSRKYAEIIKEIKKPPVSPQMSKDRYQLDQSPCLSTFKTIADEEKQRRANLLDTYSQIPDTNRNEFHPVNNYMIKSNTVIEVCANPLLYTHGNYNTNIDSQNNFKRQYSKKNNIKPNNLQQYGYTSADKSNYNKGNISTRLIQSDNKRYYQINQMRSCMLTSGNIPTTVLDTF